MSPITQGYLPFGRHQHPSTTMWLTSRLSIHLAASVWKRGHHSFLVTTLYPPDNSHTDYFSVMSTLSLYTCISSFSMISNIHATFGSIIRLGQCCRMCFEPLAIYAVSFQPFPTISDVLQCFYGISNVCLVISDLSLHRWTIYAFPIL